VDGFYEKIGCHVVHLQSEITRDRRKTLPGEQARLDRIICVNAKNGPLEFQEK
jgi:hypothetical protein